MQNTRNTFFRLLSASYTASEINEILLLAAESVSGRSRTQILCDRHTKFSENEAQKLKKIALRLQNGEPIQYILGETWFFGTRFFVNKNTLIPRPETEELVEWILAENTQASDVLDIGTGSGCIAVALARANAQFRVTAIDISPAALKIARKNGAAAGVEVDFLQENILKVPNFGKKWNIIVSNPPYIPENEMVEMDKKITLHEPSLALFVPADNPLIFYEKIGVFASKHLSDCGKLYLEIHRNFGARAKALLQSLGFKNITVKKDISGNERMLRAALQ